MIDLAVLIAVLVMAAEIFLLRRMARHDEG
jgi:hypothetical protein